MQDVTIGPFLTVSGLLMVSGAFKLVSPDGVIGAVSTLGGRVPRWAGRTLGLGEIGLGITAVVASGAIPAYLVAVAYMLLAGTVVLLRRRGAASCGCFGQIASPPSRIHLAFDLAAAILAAAHAIAGGSPDLTTLGPDSPGGWIVIVGFAGLGVAAAMALLTVLPGVLEETAAARRAAANRHERLHGHGTRLEAPVRTV
jgi:hypothetical protein